MSRNKNPMKPSVFNIGCFGIGEYKSKKNNKITREYDIWRQMLIRCYSEKNQEKHPAYIGIAVCEEWHNFQNFAEWFNENHPNIDGIRFDLDKDLLQQGVENKIYSPDTCVFLPSRINKFMTNLKSTNTSGHVGVVWHKRDCVWESSTNCFKNSKNIYIGRFTDINEASLAYKKSRAEQAEHAKDYLRSLNYLPEEIIQLIK